MARHGVRDDGALRAGSEQLGAEGARMPSYYAIPLFLVILSLALVGLLYWGGFIEERRNGRSA